MSNLSGLRGRLLLQAAVTALYALAGRTPSSGWTVPTVIVAVGAVFVALAMRPEPTWRWVVTGYEGFAVAYGAVALVSAHYVPGTLIAGYTLYFLLQHGAAAFAGAPAWDGSPVMVQAPAASVAAPTFLPPAPVQYAPPTFPPPAPVPDPAAVPAFPPPAPVAPPAFAPPEPVAYPAAAPTFPPPAAVQAAAEAPVDVPAQLPAPRPVAMTILPGK